jgi:hypothetical protein
MERNLFIGHAQPLKKWLHLLIFPKLKKLENNHSTQHHFPFL